MSQLSYNAIGLEVIHTQRMERKNVPSPDGADQTGVRWLLHVKALYNPQATSFSVGGAVAGKMAPETDAAIINALMAKRKQLTYTVGAITVIDSPGSGKVTDLTHGPNPLHCAVTQVIGAKTFIVDYAIETTLPACVTAGGGAAPSPILSNRWESSEDYDFQFLATRTISGRAVFDVARLKAMGDKTPDDFRRDLFHPVPPRFKRESVKVAATSDGTEVAYTLTDREQMISLGSGSAAVKVEGFYTVETTNGYCSGEHMLVRAWGHKMAPHTSLVNYVMQLVANKLKIVPGVTLVRSGKITTALHDRFIEANFGVFNPAIKTEGLLIPWPKDKIETQGDNILLAEGTVNNPKLPNDQNTRGYYTGKLVAAALRSPCDAYTKPTLNPPPS